MKCSFSGGDKSYELVIYPRSRSVDNFFFFLIEVLLMRLLVISFTIAV